MSLYQFSFSQEKTEWGMHPFDEEYNLCIGNGVNWWECNSKINDKWNDEIKRYMVGLTHVLDSIVKKNLQKSQQQWLKYRDSESQLLNSVYNMEGTLYRELRGFQYMLLNRDRALKLRHFFWIKTESYNVEYFLTHTTGPELNQIQDNSKLPNPDSFVINNSKSNGNNIIEKYVKTYFERSKPIKVLERTNWDSDEVRDCHIVDSYENIIISTYNCDMHLEQEFKFNNYTFKEVIRVLKLLLLEEANYIWSKNTYGPPEEDQEPGDFIIRISETDNIVLVAFYVIGC